MRCGGILTRMITACGFSRIAEQSHHLGAWEYRDSISPGQPISRQDGGPIS